MGAQKLRHEHFIHLLEFPTGNHRHRFSRALQTDRPAHGPGRLPMITGQDKNPNMGFPGIPDRFPHPLLGRVQHRHQAEKGQFPLHRFALIFGLRRIQFEPGKSQHPHTTAGIYLGQFRDAPALGLPQGHGLSPPIKPSTDLQQAGARALDRQPQTVGKTPDRTHAHRLTVKGKLL